MSNIPITSLPIANPLTGEEAVPLVQAGTTKRTTSAAISALPFGQGSTFASGISFITVTSSLAALPSSRVLAAASPITLTDAGTSAGITIGFATGTAGYVLTANGTSLAATFQSPAFTGTVTSVGISGGTTGLTISNSPITTNGTMTLGGYLNGTSIATASITATQLAANSVTSTQLSSNSVTSSKIVDNTIGFSKIQQAAGLSVIGVTGASPATIAPIVGTANQFLGVNSGGTAAAFALVAATQLSDYSVSTWSPVLTFDTPGDLNVVYSADRAATCFRLGNFVFASFQLTASTFTHSTGTGNVRVTGLPFTAGQSPMRFMSPLNWSGITKANYTDIVARIDAGTAYVILSASGSGQPLAQVTTADMPSGGTPTLRGGVIYLT